jgi:hypothetical protein
LVVRGHVAFWKKRVDERARSGFKHDWSKIPDLTEELASVKRGADTVRFRRVRKSHEGLREFRDIRRLFAHNVDDGFLREISCLPELTYLWAEKVTAEDLAPLTQLGSLEYLILEGVRKAKSFAFVAGMPTLRHLKVEWAKHLRTLDDFRHKRDLLSFGVEGATPVGMRQKVDSLKPILGWTELESLYLTATRVLDGNLRCLADLSSLRYLETARYYPRAEFDALKAAHPKLKCSWFDKWEIEVP